MKIKIENIGPIKECQMTIEDLVVVVGKNASGKSTIGKALYTLLHSISPSNQRNFEEEQEWFFSSLLRDIGYELRRFEDKNVLYELGRTVMRMKIDEEFREKKLEEFENEINTKLRDASKSEHKFSIREEESKKRISRSLEILKSFKKMDFESGDAKKRIFNKIKDIEFSNILNDYNKAGKICFEEINFEINGDKITTNYEKNISSLLNNAIIIDTPMILKFAETYREKSSHGLEDYSYHSYLIGVLYQDLLPKGLFDDVNDKDILKLEKQINEIILGNIYFDESQKFKFKNNEDKEFEVNDIATGIKTFGILMLLLRKLDKQTLLILDEPEVHLHPEWQLALAEIVVLISNKLHIKTLVSTHSVFFLEAVELYSKKYKLATNYYFCEDGIVEEVKKEELSDMYRKINGNVYDRLDKLNSELEGVD